MRLRWQGQVFHRQAQCRAYPHASLGGGGGMFLGAAKQAGSPQRRARGPLVAGSPPARCRHPARCAISSREEFEPRRAPHALPLQGSRGHVKLTRNSVVMHSKLHGAVGPKIEPGKWKHGPKPVVPWWFNLDPHPCIPQVCLIASSLNTSGANREGALELR